MKRIIAVPAWAFAALMVAGALSPGHLQSAASQKPALSPEARKAIVTVGDDMADLVASHGRYVRASREIDGLTGKLLQSVREVSKLAAETGRSGATSKKLLQAIKDMTEMSQSFNIQYLDLQQQIQDENRRFTLVSNIMKTKHDTAKNAINNIR
jgi:hypothetical protein